eukprot:tig00021428_g21167.t1
MAVKANADSGDPESAQLQAPRTLPLNLDLPTLEELVQALRRNTIETAERALAQWRLALIDLVPVGRDREAQKLIAGSLIVAGVGAAVTLGRVSGPVLGGAVIASGVAGLNHAVAAVRPKDGSRASDWAAYQRRMVAGALAGVAAGGSTLLAVRAFTTARFGRAGPVLITAQSFAVRALATSTLLGQPVLRATGLAFGAAGSGSLAGGIAGLHVLLHMAPAMAATAAVHAGRDSRLQAALAGREVAARYAFKARAGAALGSGIVAGAVAAAEPAASLAAVQHAALNGALWAGVLNAGLSTAAYAREVRAQQSKEAATAGTAGQQRGVVVGDMGMDAMDGVGFGVEGADGGPDLDLDLSALDDA